MANPKNIGRTESRPVWLTPAECMLILEAISLFKEEGYYIEGYDIDELVASVFKATGEAANNIPAEV